MNEEQKKEIYEFGESINRLNEIKEEIYNLISESERVMRQKLTQDDQIIRRSKANWMLNIRKELNSGDVLHESMEDTILDMIELHQKMKNKAKETDNNE